MWHLFPERPALGFRGQMLLCACLTRLATASLPRAGGQDGSLLAQHQEGQFMWAGPGTLCSFLHSQGPLLTHTDSPQYTIKAFKGARGETQKLRYLPPQHIPISSQAQPKLREGRGEWREVTDPFYQPSCELLPDLASAKWRIRRSRQMAKRWEGRGSVGMRARARPTSGCICYLLGQPPPSGTHPQSQTERRAKSSRGRQEKTPLSPLISLPVRHSAATKECVCAGGAGDWHNQI